MTGRMLACLVLLLSGPARAELPSAAAAEGDPAAGRAAIVRHGCGVCHAVPGIRGARGSVGPSLAGFADRNMIGGHIPNSRGWLLRWLRNPPALAPDTLMPPTGLDDRELGDVAAFLATLRMD